MSVLSSLMHLSISQPQNSQAPDCKGNIKVKLTFTSEQKVFVCLGFFIEYSLTGLNL